MFPLKREGHLVMIEGVPVGIDPIVAAQAGGIEFADMFNQVPGVVGKVTGAAGVFIKFPQRYRVAFTTHEAATFRDGLMRFEREPGSFMRETFNAGVGQGTVRPMVISMTASAVCGVGKTEVERRLVRQLTRSGCVASKTTLTHQSTRPEGRVTCRAFLAQIRMGVHTAYWLQPCLGVQFPRAEDALAGGDANSSDQSRRNCGCDDAGPCKTP